MKRLGTTARHRHRMHRRRAGRRDADRDGVSHGSQDHGRSRRSRARTRAEARCERPYRNFKLTRDADGVAWLLFDREGASANTLSADVIEELDKVLAELESAAADRPRDPLGQDIRLHRRRRRQRVSRRHRSAARSRPQIGRAHAVIDRLEALRIPTRRRDPRLLPRRRPRSGAGLPDADRDRRRALWFPGSDARPASRPRRHRALHAAGQSDAGDDR